MDLKEETEQTVGSPWFYFVFFDLSLNPVLTKFAASAHHPIGPRELKRPPPDPQNCTLTSHGAHHRIYITSTKNSLGLPMARWNDWREAVSSGGTEPRSRVGGAPGGPPGVEEGGGGRAGCMAVGICCG